MNTEKQLIQLCKEMRKRNKEILRQTKTVMLPKQQEQKPEFSEFIFW